MSAEQILAAGIEVHRRLGRMKRREFREFPVSRTKSGFFQTAGCP